jgi:Flp pilus assembly protein TadG
MNRLNLLASGMPRKRQITGAVRRFLADRRGSAISMMTAGLIPVIAALGASIDAGRMYIVKSQLQAGVDAAALAGARAFAVTDGSANSRTAQVDAYFDGNFRRSPSYMGTTNVSLQPDFRVVNGINVTTVVARATVSMSFMRIFGFANQELVATAKAELQPRPLEVMLVLDNTGSMKDNLTGTKTRITALKEAATSFINIVHQGADTRRDLAIGIVPYDVTVNVGKLLNARKPGAIQPFDGFTTGQTLLDQGTWPTNPYHWKGCVMADSTVRDVNATRTTTETGAWDLTRSLPGETLPGWGTHPAIEPYFIPPMYVPLLASASVSAAEKATPGGDFYKVALSPEPKNNLYKLDDKGATLANYLVTTPLYRRYMYADYIGLNNGAANSGDDVIRLKNGGGYYTPGDTADWIIDWTRIPLYNAAGVWSAPKTAEVNPAGGIEANGGKNKTDMPSPNWQCPEEAMTVSYGRAKSEYINYINNKNGAIYPANGTIHHSGMLWGYRLLVRDDVFTRTSPTNEQPRRAIVFMTDGLNEIGEWQKQDKTSGSGYNDRTYTWYGRWTDGRISSNPSDTNGISASETQMLRRFEKVCANVQRETNPPEVFIIALVANSTAINNAFNACAPNRVYRTSSVDELTRAFQDVAAELVDLHLIQ